MFRIIFFTIHNKNYVLSLQYGPEYTFEPYDSYVDTEKYNTIVFDELINGWSSFMSYYPTQMFSLKNSFYSIKGPSIWQHYSNLVNRGNFYNTDNQSTITFVFNQDSGINKVFQTVNYEGDSGWQVDYFLSGATGYDSVNGTWQQFQDQIQTVESYYEGVYSSNGIQYRSGFDRKENKYCANLINNTQANFATQGSIGGEVIYGDQISGIKGFTTLVTIQTDDVTDVGGYKELFTVSSNYTYSSGY